MGQSVVHPENTGQWLAFLLDAAWDAQQPDAAPTGGGAPYSEDEKLQILAFTYGFLTHAAGDSWAHTMVNELSEGIFPGVGEILTDADMAAIALRHLLVEGYVGAATAGYDNDPNEAAAAQRRRERRQHGRHCRSTLPAGSCTTPSCAKGMARQPTRGAP